VRPWVASASICVAAHVVRKLFRRAIIEALSAQSWEYTCRASIRCVSLAEIDYSAMIQRISAATATTRSAPSTLSVNRLTNPIF
jgi:hypothetical protein